MMIKLKNEGFLNEDDSADPKVDKKSGKLTIEEVVAQGIITLNEPHNDSIY